MSQYQIWEDPEKPDLGDLVVCMNCGQYVWSKQKRCKKCGAMISPKTVAKDPTERYKTLEKKRKSKSKPIVQKANGLVVLIVFLVLIFWIKVIEYFAPMLFGG